MLSKPTIIIGTDFTTQSDLALKFAEQLRKKTHGELILVHIARYPFGRDLMINDVVAKTWPDDFNAQLGKSLYKNLEELKGRCEAVCAIEVEFGRPVRGLRDLAQEKKANLLIVGHHLGTITEKLSTSLNIPLLIVKKSGAIDKVAGLVDTLELEKNVFDASEELSYLLSSDLDYLSIWQDITAQFSGSSPTMISRRFRFTEQEKKAVQSYMKRVISHSIDSRSQGHVHTEISEEKNLIETIASKLHELSVDLAILGRHQRGMIERLFVGSTTRRLLNLFDGNLLVLPPSVERSFTPIGATPKGA